MKDITLYPLLLLTLASAAAATERPSPVQQCYPTVDLPPLLSSLNANDDRLRIYSGKVQLAENQSAVFSEGVQLTHRDTMLSAPSANFDAVKQQFDAAGGISYYNPILKVGSASFQANFNDNSATLLEADYRFIHQAGRGHAGALTASGKSVELTDANFTTCPESDNGWALQAESIKINVDDGWGEASHSVIKIKDIPVFYLPYMTFPVSDKRKTGLLFPKVGSSQKLGVTYEQPIYFNLAENFDATISPRLMTQRGTQLKTEFRYLTQSQQGELQLEYLPNDQEKPQGFGSRYLTHWSHKTNLSDRWRASVDFSDVSDDAYISELGSDYNNQSDTQLYRQAQVSFYGSDIQSDLRLQGFEILGNYQNSYAALPQLDVRSARAISLPAGFEFSWNGQYSHFEKGGASNDNADRLHVEPTLRLPFITPGYELLFESSWLSTLYQQDVSEVTGVERPRRVERSLPRVLVNGKLNFERPTAWFNEDGFQTFEPQVQYLYIPYRDQSMIGLYDTARLQDDYYGLFRQNRYSGLDRINDANQVSVGWTTRLYDGSDIERLRFSMGQILYLQSPTTTLSSAGVDADGDGIADSIMQDNIAANESVLAMESQLHWQQRWYLSSGVQYDASTSRVLRSNVTLDYRADEKKLIQLNHRYSRDVSGYEIKQLGALGTVPIAESWQAVGSYYRDLTNQRLLELNLGLQYESCCWALRLVARRQTETNFDPLAVQVGNQARLDSSVSLQFVLKGFGDSAGFDVSDMLSSGIFGYRRPYLLNN